MASKLAELIVRRVSPIGSDVSDAELADAIDAALGEVREVIRSVAHPNIDPSGGNPGYHLTAEDIARGRRVWEQVCVPHGGRP